jgi:hypothetical protein
MPRDLDFRFRGRGVLLYHHLHLQKPRRSFCNFGSEALKKARVRLLLKWLPGLGLGGEDAQSPTYRVEEVHVSVGRLNADSFDRL